MLQYHLAYTKKKIYIDANEVMIIKEIDDLETQIVFKNGNYAVVDMSADIVAKEISENKK